MADLKISDDILDELQSGLKSIIDQLQGSSHFSDEIGDLVGDGDLSGKVHDFAHKWSVHRGKMIDGTTGIHDSVKMINTTFTETDNDLSHAFDQKSGSGKSGGPQ